MTETSYFWNGTATGDAANAPYDHLEFASVYNKLFTSDGAGYIIPGYANNLNVQASSPAAASVDVATGAAYVKGFLYENDALATLPIAANASGNPRIDRIVLRVDFTGQTVRLIVLQGTPAAAPALPALTQTYGTTWEISLAYVWVANGFATLADIEIHDEREFQTTAASLQRTGTRHNLIKGSEFIPKYYDTQVALGSILISGTWWATVGTTATFTTRPTQQTRGNAAIVTAPGTPSEVVQHVRVLANTTYTLRTLVKTIVSGNLVVDVYGFGSAASLVTRTIRTAAGFIDEALRFTTGATDTDVLIRFTVAAGAVAHLGQSVLLEGYHVGAFQPVHETILFHVPIFHPDWNGDVKSTSDNDYVLTTNAWGALGAFSGRDDVSAFHILIGAADSGSAAAASGAAMLSVSAFGENPAIANVRDLTIDLGGVPNSKIRWASGIISSRYFSSPYTTLANLTTSIQISVVATGAAALSGYAALLGLDT